MNKYKIMKDKLKVIEYNLGLIVMRIEKLKLSDKWNYDIIDTINKMTVKLYEITELLETIETLIEDELL